MWYIDRLAKYAFNAPMWRPMATKKIEIEVTPAEAARIKGALQSGAPVRVAIGNSPRSANPEFPDRFAQRLGNPGSPMSADARRLLQAAAEEGRSRAANPGVPGKQLGTDAQNLLRAAASGGHARTGNPGSVVIREAEHREALAALSKAGIPVARVRSVGAGEAGITSRSNLAEIESTTAAKQISRVLADAGIWHRAGGAPRKGSPSSAPKRYTFSPHRRQNPEEDLTVDEFVKVLNAGRKTGGWYSGYYSVDGKSVAVKGYGTWLQIFRVDGVNHGFSVETKTVREFEAQIRAALTSRQPQRRDNPRFDDGGMTIRSDMQFRPLLSRDDVPDKVLEAQFAHLDPRKEGKGGYLKYRGAWFHTTDFAYAPTQLRGWDAIYPDPTYVTGWVLALSGTEPEFYRIGSYTANY